MINVDEFLSTFAEGSEELPEVAMYNKLREAKPTELNSEALVDLYEFLIIGCIRARYIDSDTDPNKGTQQINKLLQYLRGTDFYVAPASTQYHDSVEGGLLRHSVATAHQALALLELDKFKGKIAPHSIIICALVHDWCKIGFYEKYMKNVKDDRTGKWRQEEAYKINQQGIPLGHGTASMFLASKFIHLTNEEALAIRWHMNSYVVSDYEESELRKAVETYPSVYCLSVADQLATVAY